MDQQSVVRARETRSDAYAAAQLNLAPLAPLFYLERLRLAGGEPLALDRVWMPHDVGSALLEVDFSHTALYDELFARTGLRLTMGRERIRAVVANAQDRALLASGPDEAALAIDRLAYAHEEPVEWRQTLIRGDRFSLVAEFSARAGYHFDLSDASALSSSFAQVTAPTPDA